MDGPIPPTQLRSPRCPTVDANHPRWRCCVVRGSWRRNGFGKPSRSVEPTRTIVDPASHFLAANPVETVKYFSPATSTAIVRVSRAYYRLVWAALSFVTKIPNPVNQPCVVQVVRVSGTIKKSEEEAIRRARSIILHARKTESVSSSITTGFTVLPSNLNQSSLDHDDVVHDIEDGIGDDDIDGDDDT